MRICILANAQSVHTQRWAAAFAERGHEVHVLSIRRQPIEGVQVHTVHVGPVNSRSVFWSLLSYVRLLLGAGRRLRRLKPDVVHASYVPTHGAIAAFAGVRPLVVSSWGADVIWDGAGKPPAYLRWLNRFALRRADAICATSRFLADSTRAFAPAGKPIHLTPFGVDVERFTPRLPAAAETTPDRPFRIGFVKTLSRKYGPDVLIRSLPRILKDVPRAVLVLAGRGPWRAKLEALAAELGLSDHVEFLGLVPHAELPDLLRSFDVFAHPSTYQSESFGVAALEASACGLPVIATRVGGVPEVCLDGRTGVLIPPNDSTALAEAVIALARRPEQRLLLGRQGAEFVRENYPWKDSVRILLEVFDDVRGDAGRRGGPAEGGATSI